MLHDCDAEIIPIEPDAGNAAAGIASTIVMVCEAVSIPYRLLSMPTEAPLQTIIAWGIFAYWL